MASQEIPDLPKSPSSRDEEKINSSPDGRGISRKGSSFLEKKSMQKKARVKEEKKQRENPKVESHVMGTMGGGRFHHGAPIEKKSVKPFRNQDWELMKVKVPEDVKPGTMFKFEYRKGKFVDVKAPKNKNLLFNTAPKRVMVRVPLDLDEMIAELTAPRKPVITDEMVRLGNAPPPSSMNEESTETSSPKQGSSDNTIPDIDPNLVYQIRHMSHQEGVKKLTSLLRSANRQEFPKKFAKIQTLLGDKFSELALGSLPIGSSVNKSPMFPSVISIMTKPIKNDKTDSEVNNEFKTDNDDDDDDEEDLEDGVLKLKKKDNVRFLNAGDVRLDDRSFFASVSTSLRPTNTKPALLLGDIGYTLGPHTYLDNRTLNSITPPTTTTSARTGKDGQNVKRGAKNGLSGFQEYQNLRKNAASKKAAEKEGADRPVYGQSGGLKAKAGSGARKALNNALFHYNNALAVYQPRDEPVGSYASVSLKCARLRAIRAERSKFHLKESPTNEDAEKAIEEDLISANSLVEDSLYATPKLVYPLQHAEIMAELSVIRFLTSKSIYSVDTALNGYEKCVDLIGLELVKMRNGHNYHLYSPFKHTNHRASSNASSLKNKMKKKKQKLSFHEYYSDDTNDGDDGNMDQTRYTGPKQDEALDGLVCRRYADCLTRLGECYERRSVREEDKQEAIACYDKASNVLLEGSLPWCRIQARMSRATCSGKVSASELSHAIDQLKHIIEAVEEDAKWGAIDGMTSADIGNPSFNTPTKNTHTQQSSSSSSSSSNKKVSIDPLLPMLCWQIARCLYKKILLYNKRINFAKSKEQGVPVEAARGVLKCKEEMKLYLEKGLKYPFHEFEVSNQDTSVSPDPQLPFLLAWMLATISLRDENNNAWLKGMSEEDARRAGSHLDFARGRLLGTVMPVGASGVTRLRSLKSSRDQQGDGPNKGALLNPQLFSAERHTLLSIDSALADAHASRHQPVLLSLRASVRRQCGYLFSRHLILHHAMYLSQINHLDNNSRSYNDDLGNLNKSSSSNELSIDNGIDPTDRYSLLLSHKLENSFQLMGTSIAARVFAVGGRKKTGNIHLLLQTKQQSNKMSGVVEKKDIVRGARWTWCDDNDDEKEEEEDDNNEIIDSKQTSTGNDINDDPKKRDNDTNDSKSSNKKKKKKKSKKEAQEELKEQQKQKEIKQRQEEEEKMKKAEEDGDVEELEEEGNGCELSCELIPLGLGEKEYDSFYGKHHDWLSHDNENNESDSDSSDDSDNDKTVRKQTNGGGPFGGGQGSPFLVDYDNQLLYWMMEGIPMYGKFDEDDSLMIGKVIGEIGADLTLTLVRATGMFAQASAYAAEATKEGLVHVGSKIAKHVKEFRDDPEVQAKAAELKEKGGILADKLLKKTIAGSKIAAKGLHTMLVKSSDKLQQASIKAREEVNRQIKERKEKQDRLAAEKTAQNEANAKLDADEDGGGGGGDHSKMQDMIHRRKEIAAQQAAVAKLKAEQLKIAAKKARDKASGAASHVLDLLKKDKQINEADDPLSPKHKTTVPIDDAGVEVGGYTPQYKKPISKKSAMSGAGKKTPTRVKLKFGSSSSKPEPGGGGGAPIKGEGLIDQTPRTIRESYGAPIPGEGVDDHCPNGGEDENGQYGEDPYEEEGNNAQYEEAQEGYGDDPYAGQDGENDAEQADYGDNGDQNAEQADYGDNGDPNVEQADYGDNDPNAEQADYGDNGDPNAEQADYGDNGDPNAEQADYGDNGDPNAEQADYGNNGDPNADQVDYGDNGDPNAEQADYGDNGDPNADQVDSGNSGDPNAEQANYGDNGDPKTDQAECTESKYSEEKNADDEKEYKQDYKDSEKASFHETNEDSKNPEFGESKNMDDASFENRFQGKMVDEDDDDDKRGSVDEVNRSEHKAESKPNSESEKKISSMSLPAVGSFTSKLGSLAKSMKTTAMHRLKINDEDEEDDEDDEGEMKGGEKEDPDGGSGEGNDDDENGDAEVEIEKEPEIDPDNVYELNEEVEYFDTTLSVWVDATVKQIDYDDELIPSFVIALGVGRERNTVNDRIRHKTEEQLILDLNETVNKDIRMKRKLSRGKKKQLGSNLFLHQKLDGEGKEGEHDQDDDITISTMDDNGNHIKYEKMNAKKTVYEHVGAVPEVEVIAHPRAVEALRVSGRYSHLKLVESIHAISATTVPVTAASPPLTSFDLRGIWRASHAAYEISVPSSTNVTARRKAANATKSLIRGRRKIARRVQELSETKELLYHSTPISAEPSDFTFAMSAGGNPMWRDLRAQWMLPPVPPSKLMHHVLDAVAEFEAICAHHCCDHPFLAAVSVLPSWGRLPVALMNRKHKKVTRPAVMTQLPQVNVAAVSLKIANSNTMKNLVTQVSKAKTAIETKVAGNGDIDNDDNVNDDDNSQENNNEGEDRQDNNSNEINAPISDEDTKQETQIKEEEKDDQSEIKKKLTKPMKSTETAKEEEEEEDQGDEENNRKNRRHSLTSLVGMTGLGLHSNHSLNAAGGGGGLGIEVLEEETRKARGALHLMTRDFPRPEALVDLVQSNEALLTWITSQDGRLLAVLVYREKILVKADPFGRPMIDPQNTGGAKIVGGAVHDQLKAAGGFWGKVADNFSKGQRDIDSGVAKAKIAKDAAAKVAKKIKSKTDKTYSGVKDAYQKRQERQSLRRQSLEQQAKTVNDDKISLDKVDNVVKIKKPNMLDKHKGRRYQPSKGSKKKSNLKNSNNYNEEGNDKEEEEEEEVDVNLDSSDSDDDSKPKETVKNKSDEIVNDMSDDDIKSDKLTLKKSKKLKNVTYGGVALRGLLNQVKKEDTHGLNSEEGSEGVGGGAPIKGEGLIDQTPRPGGESYGAPIPGEGVDDHYSDHYPNGGEDENEQYGEDPYGEAGNNAQYEEAGDYAQEGYGDDPYAGQDGESYVKNSYNDNYYSNEGEGYDYAVSGVDYNGYGGEGISDPYDNGGNDEVYGEEVDYDFSQQQQYAYNGSNNDDYNYSDQYYENGENVYNEYQNDDFYNEESQGGGYDEPIVEEVEKQPSTMNKESFIEKKRREFKMKQEKENVKMTPSPREEKFNESNATTTKEQDISPLIDTLNEKDDDHSVHSLPMHNPETFHPDDDGSFQNDNMTIDEDEDGDVCSFPSNVRVRLCVGAADGVEHLNKKVQTLLDAIKATKSIQIVLEEISPLLGVEAWVDAIPEHVTELTLVLPAMLSPLSVIPFQALPISGGSTQMLGDRFVLRTASSLSLHALSEAQSTIPPAAHLKRMVVIADPSEPIERRVDGSSGIAYTLEEFVEFYGGTREWHSAQCETPMESFRENSKMTASPEVKCLLDVWSQVLLNGGEQEDWAVAYPTTDLLDVKTPPPRALIESFKKKEIAKLRSRELRRAENEAQNALIASRVATTRANQDKRKLERKRKLDLKKNKSKAFRKKQKQKLNNNDNDDDDEDDLLLDDEDFEVDDDDEEENMSDDETHNGRDATDIFRAELTSSKPASELSLSLATARCIHFSVAFSYLPSPPAIQVSTTTTGKGIKRFNCSDVLSRLYLKHCGLVVVDKGGMCNEVNSVNDLTSSNGKVGISFGGRSSLEDAFLLAGARTVIYPLWTTKIGLFCNELLMLYFYTVLGDEVNMKEKYNISAALADAQFWLRTSSYHEFRRMIYLQKKLSKTAKLDLIRKLDVHINEFDGLGSEVPFKDPIWWSAFQLVGAGRGSHDMTQQISKPDLNEKENKEEEDGMNKGDEVLSPVVEADSDDDEEDEEEDGEDDEEVDDAEVDGGVEAQTLSEEFSAYMKKRGELEPGETMERVMNAWMKEKQAKAQHEAMIEKKHREAARAKNTAQRTLAQAQRRREEAQKEEEKKQKMKLGTAKDRKREAEEKKAKAAAAYKKKILGEVADLRKEKEKAHSSHPGLSIGGAEEEDEMKPSDLPSNQEKEENATVVDEEEEEMISSSKPSSLNRFVSNNVSLMEHETDEDKEKYENDQQNEDISMQNEKMDGTNNVNADVDNDDDDDLWARLEKEENEKEMKRKQQTEEEEEGRGMNAESEADFWSRMEKEEEKATGADSSTINAIPLEERIRIRKEAKAKSEDEELTSSVSEAKTDNRNKGTAGTQKSAACLVM